MHEQRTIIFCMNDRITRISRMIRPFFSRPRKKEPLRLFRNFVSIEQMTEETVEAPDAVILISYFFA